MAATQFTTEQLLPFSIALKDGLGRPAQYEGSPVMASSDDTVATAAMDEGSTTDAKVMPGIPGTATITVTVDTDLNPDVVNPSIGVLDVEVTLDPRTGQRIVTITPGTPVDKPV